MGRLKIAAWLLLLMGIGELALFLFAGRAPLSLLAAIAGLVSAACFFVAARHAKRQALRQGKRQASRR